MGESVSQSATLSVSQSASQPVKRSRRSRRTSTLGQLTAADGNWAELISDREAARVHRQHDLVPIAHDVIKMAVPLMKQALSIQKFLNFPQISVLPANIAYLFGKVFSIARAEKQTR